MLVPTYVGTNLCWYQNVGTNFLNLYKEVWTSITFSTVQAVPRRRYNYFQLFLQNQVGIISDNKIC